MERVVIVTTTEEFLGKSGESRTSRGGKRLLASTTRLAITTRARRLLTVLVLVAVAGGTAGVEAASVAVSWNAPTTNADGTRLTDLAGYRLYLGTVSPTCPSGSFHAVSSSTSAPAPGDTASANVTALSAGTTYFARVTAIDANGNESACSTAASGVAKADFTVTPSTTTSFGSVTVGSTVDRAFTVQNTSTASISGVASVGAPFSIVSGSSFSLTPGATQAVTVRFRPTTAGSFAGNVNFTANGDTVSRGVSGSAASGSSLMTITVTKSGTGAGTVTSSPAGIACGTTCTNAVAVATPMTLTASPASGSIFSGWTGACSGTATCILTVNTAITVTAIFNKVPSVPVASSLSPASAAAGSAALTLTVNGSGFVASSVVRWNGASRTTTFVSASQLRAAITASDLIAAKSVPVSVVTPAPGGGTSGTVTFTITPAVPPVPVASSVSPTSATARSAALTLTVNGSGFVGSSVVRWNGASRTTTFVSASQLRAAITASDLATARSVPVSVVTPSPGGGTSGSVTFTVTTAPSVPPPAPGAPSVTKTSADATGVTFTIAWGAVSGATSYRYVAAFTDGSASQQGTVTARSFQLRMPYHSSGAAFGAVVCIRSVNATGQQSTNQSCSPVPVPARPVAPPPPPEYGWGVG
ncbi:MAG TPA: choice-of-anchor D domain-containing protein [Candidatus Acidoferrum sp.]|nr:choice-of-anchor D domain-containing protein [Candidatus Acidoferrum sp.]